MSRNFDDASSQYLKNSNAIVTVDPMTFACWFQTDDTGLANAQRLMVIADTSTVNGLPLRAVHIAANAVGLRAHAHDGTTQGVAANTVTINASTWYHAAAVFTSVSSRAVFFDGANKSTNSTTINALTGADATILAARELNDIPAIFDELSGQLAEAGIWNVALSDAEIAILALGRSPLLVRPASLVSYWKLIGRNSPEIDIVGGYDMALNNGPTTAPHPRVFYPGLPEAFFAPAVDVAANINISPGASYIQIV